MKIILENLGKKFRNEWIFRNVSLELNIGKNYTLVGPNGSGKSTLLQVISGILPQNEGKVNYFLKNKEVLVEEIYKQIIIAAPYLELVEEFTLLESIVFHQKFKPFKNNFSPNEILDFLQLTPHKDKTIKNFSSGMKQRLKLGLAFYSDCPIILLDEPTSNLDVSGINWYSENIEKHTKDRILIICSNQPTEYTFCENVIDIRGFKKSS